MAGQVKAASRRKTFSEPIRYSARLIQTWPWVPIAFVQGVLSTWIISLLRITDMSSRDLAVICGIMLVQTLATCILIIGPARSWLRAESVIQSFKWIMNPESLAAWTLPVLLGTGIIFALAGAGFTFYSADLNVISMCVVVIAVANGMRRLYKTEYVEVTNPKYRSSMQIESLPRRTLSIVLGVAPHHLRFPLLQSVIAVVIPSLLVVQLGVSVIGMSYDVATAFATAFVPVWGIVWAEWNLRGGLVRLLRFGHGRPLNPAAKPINTIWERFGLSRRKVA